MTDQPYQVLARKYRPQVFKDLIGQEHMVRVLRNSFENNRIHHAFILTGVRGVGKTTTARIIAKGLNCTAGEKPTIEPCGQCDSCIKITESTHVDVFEMDAASRTGVNDVREIIEAVPYRAASARYKVYIIDEVHMLSTQAFNALLKTLEEPPEHTKFIFATTDIHKIPVTVLSRCQRFDLRRIDETVLRQHLVTIATQEKANISTQALALIARAGEGSVRDALSLMDQAVSQALQPGFNETLDIAAVRTMLGLGDRTRTIELFEYILAGETAKSLENLQQQFQDSADPVAILRDLTELSHLLSIEKIIAGSVSEHAHADRLQQIAGKITIRALNRCWQILLKGLEGIGAAPSTIMGAEMLVIQLTHAATLPAPDDLLRTLSTSTSTPSGYNNNNQLAADVASSAISSSTEPLLPPPAQEEKSVVTSFEQMHALVRQKNDIKLAMDIEQSMRIESFSNGRIVFTPTESAPRNLASELSQKLTQWTGTRWIVSVISDCTAKTYNESIQAAHQTLEEKAAAHPAVVKALSIFPDAKIKSVKKLQQM